MAWGSNVNTIDRSIGVYQGNPEIGKFGAEERKRKYYGDVSKALRGINETVDGKSDEELQAMKADLMKQLEEIKSMPIDQPIQEPIQEPIAQPSSIPSSTPTMPSSEPTIQSKAPVMAPLFGSNKAPMNGINMYNEPLLKPLYPNLARGI